MNRSNGKHPTPRRRRLTALLAVVASIGLSLAIPAAAAQPTTTPGQDLQPLVIGGVDTLNDGFVAALLQASIADPGLAQFCGGSLISPNVVITAAHCVDSITPADVDIAVGKTLLSNIAATDRIAVADILIHPLWVPGGFDGVDIALLKLATDVTTVAPVILETDPVEPSLGRGMVVAGWGFTDPIRTVLLDTLQSAAVFAQTGVDTTPATMTSLCGSTQPGDDVCFGDITTAACNGDSGGPILGLTDPINGVLELEALVSFGPAGQCLSPVWWDAGQRVSPYKTWIDAGIAAWAPPPPVTLPGAPGTPTVVRGNASADISWTPPADDGGDPNITYTVTGSPDGSCISNTTSCHITGMSNGVIHSFTVTATNSAGTGPASQPSTAVLAATLINCSAQTHPFLDVPAGSFASADIGCIATLNVTTGTSPTTYNPAGNVTREQMAAFLARLYRTITGLPCGGGPLPFIDVPTGPFTADIGCILSLNVTTGTSPTTYNPAGNVTREQMAAFLARLYRTITGLPCGGGPLPFTDVPTGSFAAADIGCILALGVTTGTSPTTYNPAGNVTREQMAAFLARLYRTITQ